MSGGTATSTACGARDFGALNPNAANVAWRRLGTESVQPSSAAIATESPGARDTGPYATTTGARRLPRIGRRHRAQRSRRTTLLRSDPVDAPRAARAAGEPPRRSRASCDRDPRSRAAPAAAIARRSAAPEDPAVRPPRGWRASRVLMNASDRQLSAATTRLGALQPVCKRRQRRPSSVQQSSGSRRRDRPVRGLSRSTCQRAAAAVIRLHRCRRPRDRAAPDRRGASCARFTTLDKPCH